MFLDFKRVISGVIDVKVSEIRRWSTRTTNAFPTGNEQGPCAYIQCITAQVDLSIQHTVYDFTSLENM